MIQPYLKLLLQEPISCISVFVTIIPLYFIFKKKAYIDPAFLLLTIFLFIKLLIDLIMYHYAAMVKNNLIFYNLFIPIRYVLLSGMFIFKVGLRDIKSLVLITSVGFVAFFVWDIRNINPDFSNLHNHQMVLFSATIESVLMIFWTLLYFYDAIRTLKIPNLLAYPFFWVCSGLLIFFSSLVFIAPVLHYTEKWNKTIDIGFLNNVPYIFEMLCTAFITVGVINFSKNIYAER